ncbi:S-layer homology domain-containing protein [Paenibacillus ginsengarvi]|uniref:S-layer homology domain-containing protein n=1 Tax=Paenibacillus ginsengarvi TaxID=400777 RepID=A0A3B0BHM3_9BACL|nr:S-layer homology domain-containing protein [Paenibacillus ginsengarvi]RKN72400.1 S-layer homology domain-containing protein [Paenibacillus ginsengarvi]
MKSKMKKTLKLAAAYSIVSTMVLAAPAYAAETTGGTSSTSGNTSSSSSSQSASNIRVSFPDVPSSHWASKHITRLAVEGVVEGNELGRYSPEQAVSQQDVIIMAIRMMGLESAALQSKSNVALPFGEDDVRKDARPYVAYAIDQGLIDLQEEYTAGKKWGTKEAPREWVAKVVIRAIGKKQEALAKAGTATAFADNNKISSSLVGYVNAAVELGLVNGFEDNTFRPDGSVTRAQMATFWSRGEKYLVNPSNRILTGTVMAINGSKLSIRDKNGTNRDVQLSSNAVYFTYKDDTTRLSASDIKLYNEVYVLQNQGTAYFVEVTNDEIPMKSIEGTLVSVNVNDLTASIQVAGKYYTYELASNVSVRDLNGAGLSLGSLVENSVVELKKHAMIEDAKVSQIIVKKAPVNKTVNGVFQSFDPATMTAIVKDRDTGALETYTNIDKAIFSQGGKFFDPANLFEGDIVRVVVKNDKITGIEVVQQVVEKRDAGKLISISEDKTIITVQKAGDELASYRVSEKALVVLGDNQFGSVRDLMPGDEMKLEINQNKVDKITVTSRTIENLTLATIEDFNLEKKYLILKDDLGKLKIYTISDTTVLKFDENALPLDTFKTYLVKGKRVNVVASQDKLISVQFATKMEGTVVSVSATTGEITIKTANGVNQTYKTTSSVFVNKYSQSLAKLSDLRAGDYIRGFFDSSQENVISISVRETHLAHTTSIDSTGNSITVQDLTGGVKTFSLFALPVHKNGTAVGIGSIQLDEPVLLTSIGGSVESVQVVDAVRGKVSSVDAAAGKIALVDYSNNSQLVEVGKNVTVKSGATVLASIAVLNPEDRVEIVKDSSGNVTVLVIAPEKWSYLSFDSTTKEITFMRRTIADKPNYFLHNKAYVHQGTQTIAPNSFVSGEELTVYFLNGKVLEIVKP